MERIKIEIDGSIQQRLTIGDGIKIVVGRNMQTRWQATPRTKEKDWQIDPS